MRNLRRFFTAVQSTFVLGMILAFSGCGKSTYVSTAVIEATTVAPRAFADYMKTNSAAHANGVIITALDGDDRYQLQSTAESKELANDRVGKFLMALTTWDQNRAFAKMKKERKRQAGTDVVSFKIVQLPTAGKANAE